MDPRALAALWTGKLVIAASRKMGRGGSTLPGRIALKVDPSLLGKLARLHRLGNVVVTGTNGKTTTARMLAGILNEQGYSVTHNRAGANLMTGITTAFAESAPLIGSVLKREESFRDIGLAEVDEATMPYAARQLQPRLVVVTNFFRDQLDRYGELQTTVGMVRRGLEAAGQGVKVILNADDPLAASLGVANLDARASNNGNGTVTADRALYYGLEIPPRHYAASGWQSGDARHCVICGQPYRYSMSYYAHLGHYLCAGCGHRRPIPQVSVIKTEPGDNSWRLQVHTPAGELWLRLPVGGLYNVYNALAAVAAAYTLGIPLQVIKQGLEKYAAGFGRMEIIRIRGREVCIALVKNPVGFNEVLRSVITHPGKEGRRVLIAINDNYADGRDISWLWDVDFEQLEAEERGFEFIATSGQRAEEMVLRLKYAGFPVSKVDLNNNLEKALESSVERTPAGGRLWLLPTYTALLEVRKIIHHWGFAPRFWEV